MRIAVVINPKAGSVKAGLLEEKIREALFRCDISIHISESLGSMDEFIDQEIGKKADFLVICGGDGTVNASLQTVMKKRESGRELPPLCLICSGTANDLAHEMGITEKVDQAARMILEGQVKKIDVIEVTGDGTTKFMLTNGGLGIPAMTAEKANFLRSFLQARSACQKSHPLLKKGASLTYQAVKKMGSAIYSMMLLDSLRQWKSENWKLEIELPDEKKISTTAPFIMVNNQAATGGTFITAPYTFNNDGLVNLLLVEADHLKNQLQQIIQVSRGNISEDVNRVFELPEFRIKAKEGSQKLTFFGDGEILFKDVSELTVKCLKQSVSVVVK